MPKRRNPFGDCVPLQFKTHVGMKEIATGCLREELMKNVYERTQEKLFTAMKSDRDLNANHMQIPVDPAGGAEGWQCGGDPQQMVLDQAGLLSCPAPPRPAAPDHRLPALPRPAAPDHSNMLWSHRPVHLPEMKSPMVTPVADLFGQEADCRQFLSWMHSGMKACRDATPVSSLPAMGGQLCLDSRGQLSAPHHSTALNGHVNLHGSGAGPGVNEWKKPGAHAGGLERWGFMRTSTPAPQIGRANSQISREPTAMMCQACQHTPVRGHCQFCERRICEGCGRQCHACGHHFCAVCSRLDYDTSVERAFCLSCVG